MPLSFLAILKYYGYWLMNIFLKVTYLQKRDENLWIFGAWNGKKYSDNSKFLFEYVQENHPEIKAVWITKDPSLQKQIQALGYTCYLSSEKAGRKARLKAGTVFYTNGMKDFGELDLCHGARIVALWHGMPLKKLWFATNYAQKKNLRNKIKEFTLQIYFDKRRTISIATSKKSADFLQESFRLKPGNIQITGQPRNDALFNAKNVDKTKRILKHSEEERFILYMPTWREQDLKGISFLDDLLEKLYQDQAYLQLLEEKKCKLYIKPHPNLQLKSKSKGNIILLSPTSSIDSQHLLAAADVLITDYSSAFIDYALLDRPVFFYVPDLEEYEQGKLGTFLKFEEFAQHWETSLEGFQKFTLSNSETNQLGIENSASINFIYNDAGLVKGEYCKKVVETLLKR